MDKSYEIDGVGLRNPLDFSKSNAKRPKTHLSQVILGSLSYLFQPHKATTSLLLLDDNLIIT